MQVFSIGYQVIRPEGGAGAHVEFYVHACIIVTSGKEIEVTLWCALQFTLKLVKGFHLFLLQRLFAIFPFQRRMWTFYFNVIDDLMATERGMRDKFFKKKMYYWHEFSYSFAYTLSLLIFF